MFRMFRSAIWQVYGRSRMMKKKLKSLSCGKFVCDTRNPNTRHNEMHNCPQLIRETKRHGLLNVILFLISFTIWKNCLSKALGLGGKNLMQVLRRNMKIKQLLANKFTRYDWYT